MGDGLFVARRVPGVATSPTAGQPAKRPYGLRHACLSTWLNAGGPPTQVAKWAGNSVKVLLDVYAKCLDGGTAAALHRIAWRWGSTDPSDLGAGLRCDG